MSLVLPKGGLLTLRVALNNLFLLPDFYATSTCKVFCQFLPTQILLIFQDPPQTPLLHSLSWSPTVRRELFLPFTLEAPCLFFS